MFHFSSASVNISRGRMECVKQHKYIWAEFTDVTLYSITYFFKKQEGYSRYWIVQRPCIMWFYYLKSLIKQRLTLFKK